MVCRKERMVKPKPSRLAPDYGYKEALQLACTRFLAGEQPMSVSDGHAWNPMKTATYCDTKAKIRDAIVSRSVTCPMCRAAIEHHAETYKKEHGL